MPLLVGSNAPKRIKRLAKRVNTTSGPYRSSKGGSGRSSRHSSSAPQKVSNTQETPQKVSIPEGKYLDKYGNVVNENGQIIQTAEQYQQALAAARRLGVTLPQYTKIPEAQNYKYENIQPEYVPRDVKELSVDSPGGEGYFMGDYALVKFTGGGANPETYWLADKQNKTLRPFSSKRALENLYGDISGLSVVNLSTAELAPGGKLAGFERLSPDYAIREDGTYKGIEISPAELRARYGKQKNPNLEQQAYMLLDGYLDTLRNENGTVSPSFLQKIAQDKNAMAFYINALAYGGYSLSDIYMDLKRKELIASGRSDVENVFPISASREKQEYEKTPEAITAYQKEELAPPTTIAGLDRVTLSLPLYDIPSEAFKTLVPIIDVNSEEFKNNFSQIESAYHDVLLQQLEAKTEQEKAIADYNWNQFRENVQKTLGIQLSNNASDAWKQIEGAYNSFASQGVYGSGIMNESIDDYLRSVRRQDQLLRENKVTQEERGQMEYFLKYATPEQIQELKNKDPEKAKRWGLVPSDEVKNFFTYQNLKNKYPELDDATINRYIASMLDENGNYRSNLYQRYMTGGNYSADPANVRYIKDPVTGEVNAVVATPGDTGKLDIEVAKTQFQRDTALLKALQEEKKKYLPYTKADTPFLRAGEQGSAPTQEKGNLLPLDKIFQNKEQQEQQGQLPRTLNPTLKPQTVAVRGNKNISGGAINLNKEQLKKILQRAPKLSEKLNIKKQTPASNRYGNRVSSTPPVGGASKTKVAVKGAGKVRSGSLSLSSEQVARLRKNNPSLAQRLGFL